MYDEMYAELMRDLVSPTAQTKLASSGYDVSGMESGNSGLDAFISDNPHFITARALPKKQARTKVASLATLDGFLRVADDTLIHKSTQDLWALQKEADGNFYVQRLFDDTGDPLKST